MSLAEIQGAVDCLPPEERLQLTAWIVARHPILRVDQLRAQAAALVDRGEWSPTPPTDDNRPQGKLLDRGLRVAEQLGLGK